jgi:rubrerythrin
MGAEYAPLPGDWGRSNMETKRVREALQEALLLEARGRAFYLGMAGQALDPGVRSLFAFLADEEEKHIAELHARAGAHARGEDFAAPPARRTADEVIDPTLEVAAAGAGFEAAAISAAIALEERAAAAYERRAAATPDADERAFWIWLADWEKGHLKLLAGFDEELRERVFADQQFWPFG